MAQQHAAVALETRDVVDAVFSKLDGVTLARSSCVCKLWNEAARLDRLWQTAYESAAQGAFQRNTRTQLPALLQAAGGWRGLYLAYRRTALMPKRRVWVDNGQGGVHVPVSIAEGSKVTMGDAVVCGAQGQQTAASQQNFTWSPDGALVAHTLVYRSTAGILGSSIASAVMIVDVTTGRRVRVDLDVPYPPFYFHWSPVALRIMEVPLAWFVSPVSLEDSPRPKVVQAALGRPLFISWSPDGSTIVHAVDGERCSLLDIDFALEQGHVRDSEPHIELQSSHLPPEFVQSLKAPFWLQDAEERQWLLLPETATEWPGVEAMQGNVVLLRTPRLTRQQPGLLPAALPADFETRKCTLGSFSTTQSDVAFAATRDASAIAWLTGHSEVFAVLRQPGNTPAGLPAYSKPQRVFPVPGLILRSPYDNSIIGGPPVAMQWSPNGRRLLMLLMSAAFGGPQGVQKVQWVVWDRLASGTSAFTVCDRHHAPQEFVQSQASFFDSYAQAGTLWATTSDAFCHSALPQGDEDHLQSDFSIYVQPVPHPEPAADMQIADDSRASSSQSGEKFVVLSPPAPVRILSGRSANWSPR